MTATTPTPDRKDDLEPVAWRNRHHTETKWTIGELDLSHDPYIVSEPLYGPDAKARIEALEGLLEAAGKYQATFQAQRDAAEGMWIAFGQHFNWELSFSCEDDEGAWTVHAVNGGVNDREWTKIGTGNTPADAVRQALAAIKGEA